MPRSLTYRVEQSDVRVPSWAANGYVVLLEPDQAEPFLSPPRVEHGYAIPVVVSVDMVEPLAVRPDLARPLFWAGSVQPHSAPAQDTAVVFESADTGDAVIELERHPNDRCSSS